MKPLPLSSRRAAWRLGVALLALTALDQWVPSIRDRLEVAQYETIPIARFTNSDVFPLEAHIAYLREHPRGPVPRVAFFGDSVVWGYAIHDVDSIPAQYQLLATETQVLNLGVNNFATPSAYLLASRVIDAIDVAFLFPADGPSHALLPRVLDLTDAEANRWGYPPPDRTALDRWTNALVSRWQLYRDAHRIQAALWGTSTKQFLYVNKRQLVGAVRKRWRGERQSAVRNAPDSAYLRSWDVMPAVETAEDRGGEIDGVRGRQPALVAFAELVAGLQKHAYVIEVAEGRELISTNERASMNARFAPYVRFVLLTPPKRLRFDGLHFTPEGAATVASMLDRIRRTDAPARSSIAR